MGGRSEGCVSIPTGPDPLLEGMARVAVPLDEWCDLCEMKLAVGTSEDGVKACGDCMEQVLTALKKYEDDAKIAASVQRRASNGSVVTAKAAKAKAKRRAKRKRTRR